MKSNSYFLRFQNTKLPESNEIAIEEKYRILSREAHGLFIEKNNAYKSIFLQFGTQGIFVRIRDKLARLLSKDESVSDEDIVENFLDIANYALMGAMIECFDLKTDRKCTHLFTVEQTNDDEVCLRCVNCENLLKFMPRPYESGIDEYHGASTSI